MNKYLRKETLIYSDWKQVRGSESGGEGTQRIGVRSLGMVSIDCDWGLHGLTHLSKVIKLRTKREYFIDCKLYFS